MKVLWEENPDSYMHIFIDSTNIKRLEEEKAKTSCQQLMFASVSHEFRTPLNAFENSLDLIKMNFDGILKSMKPFINHRVKPQIDRNIQQIEKFMKMGKISSKLLMNLVEDILDLEKFNSGFFTHNISKPLLHKYSFF